MNRTAQDAPVRKTGYTEHRVDAAWDVLSNPDYLVMRPEHAALGQLLQKQQPALIVDVGCGNKRFASLIQASSPGSRYIGYDVENNRAGTVDAVIEGADKLPLNDEEADLIICSHVLEHLHKPKESIKEFFRVTRTGTGHVFVSAPLFEQEHEQPYDYFRYTQFGLRYLFEEAGFHRDRIEVHPWGGAVSTAAQVLINYLSMMPKHKTGICMRVFKQIFFARPIMWLFNYFASRLDRLYFRPNPVMGYIVIARK